MAMKQNVEVNHMASWMADAACSNELLEYFFAGRNPDGLKMAREAQQCCWTECTQRENCSQYYLLFPTRETVGIWAGLTERQRKIVARRKRQIAAGKNLNADVTGRDLIDATLLEKHPEGTLLKRAREAAVTKKHVSLLEDVSDVKSIDFSDYVHSIFGDEADEEMLWDDENLDDFI